VPELVDLLVTTIEAGIGFGSALQLSARRVRDPLGSELRLTLGEQAMGLTMSEALQNMLERTNRSTSMRAFVQSIVQGETMGVSMGRTLRDLAVDMRKRRKQAAEERAQKAPIKLLFPLTFLILPAMLLVILTPAVRAISHGLGGGF
jgi:tight adherence protein C